MEWLLTEFERVTHAADAISRIRRFVVDTAVRGRLVPQHPDDRMEFKISSARPATAVPQARPAYDDHPPLWVATSIESCFAELGDGRTLHQGWSPQCEPQPAADGEWGMLKTTAIQERTFEPEHNKHLPEQLEPRPLLQVAVGDLLITCAGPRARCGISCLVRLAAPQRLISGKMYRFRVRSGIAPAFMELFLQSDRARQAIDGMKTGSSESGLNLTHERFRQLPVVIPPLAEQHRIVAKVDELMAVCDELEAAQKERENRRDRLAVSSLHRLTASEGEDPGKESARFYFNILPQVTTKIEHVAELRKTIWDLAVRGRLVPQDSSDEAATKALLRTDECRAERAKTDRRASLGRQQLLGAELRWDVPATWEWRGLADLVLFIDYRGRTPSKVARGVRLITAKNVRRGYVSLDPEEFITDGEYAHWMTRGLPEIGDVLFTTEAPMGNVAVVRLLERFALAQRVINFRPYGAIDPYFLALQLSAPPFQSILEGTATGLTAKGIKAAKLKRLPIAVPPLAEQHRIVAKVDELTAVCDELERALRHAQEQRAKLLEAVLAEALEERTLERVG